MIDRFRSQLTTVNTPSSSTHLTLLTDSLNTITIVIESFCKPTSATWFLHSKLPWIIDYHQTLRRLRTGSKPTSMPLVSQYLNNKLSLVRSNAIGPINQHLLGSNYLAAPFPITVITLCNSSPRINLSYPRTLSLIVEGSPNTSYLPTSQDASPRARHPSPQKNSTSNRSTMSGVPKKGRRPSGRLPIRSLILKTTGSL